jgi:LuxR family maltose regulon positive regulatory protein
MRLELVERRSLMTALARADEPLVLVCAPAGAGKTTTLALWAAADERPVVWLQIEEADDDPVVLLLQLVRALCLVVAIDPVVEASLALPVPPVRERVLPLLDEALAQAPPFLLVLDDAHLLAGAGCWDVIAFVLRGLPPGAQLALGTRAEPPLALARMRTAGEVAELRAADLAFDRGEAERLLRAHACGPLDPSALDTLFDVTEGWAAGLRLACRASCDAESGAWLPRVGGDRREIVTYLTSEVIDCQPRHVQEFLLRVSVLRELTPALCRSVSGRDDAGVLLEEAARDELFVVPAGTSGHRYRFHHLFADVLREELERRRPGEAAELHRRAAAWYARHDDPDAAIHHLLMAGDVAAAGDVVAASWLQVWTRGQVETVRRWLQSFSDRQILAHRALTLTAGWVYTALDAGELGARWGRAACSATMTDEPSPDGAASLRSSQALLRATVALDGVRRMREDAELAAGLETTVDSSWYADAQVALGVARWLSGSGQRARHPLDLGAGAGSVHNPAAELAALGYLALIAVEQGDWRAAEEHEARARARLAELGFGTNRRCLPMLLARAQLLARDPRADLDEAEAGVQRILEHMVPHPWMALLAHAVLGEVTLERGDRRKAAAHAAAADAMLRRYPDAGILRRRAERLRGAVEATRIAEPLTAAEHKVLELLPTHLTEAQVAGQLFVTRNTVKTHVKSVYRKLGVASRAEAVRRARETGLLPPG